MIGTTSSGTLIVLLGMYVLYVRVTVESGIIDSPLRPWLGDFKTSKDNEAWNQVSAARRSV